MFVAQRWRTVVVLFIFLLVMLGVGAFVYRVVHYTRTIQLGEELYQDLVFSDAFTADTTGRALVPDLATGDAKTLVTTDDPVIGKLNAPLTIVEFADFGCPHSRTASDTLRRLAAQYPNEIVYFYRDFPLEELHPGATLAAEAGACALAQGKFWEYHDKLFLNQTDLRKERLISLAREVGLQPSVFTDCLETRRYQEEVAADVEAGQKAGVVGTPTFFLNGHPVTGAIPASVLESIIRRVAQL